MECGRTRTSAVNINGVIKEMDCYSTMKGKSLSQWTRTDTTR